jgi:tetratricopeptide (TPR) repeat protein
LALERGHDALVGVVARRARLMRGHFMDVGSLVVFAALTWSATDDPIATFRDALERARADYAPVLEANERRLLQGRMKEATQALLDVVAKDRRTAAHAFALGNTLFDMEPELAMALHEEAYAKAPAIAPVAMEWALELHRAGRIPEAEALYRTLSDDASLGSSQNVIHALRAECLLRLDRPRDAVDSWRRVTLETIPDSTRVEKAACWIHFGPSSFARRDALLRAVDAGDVEAAEELILLDLNFKRDWWNSGIHHEYLKADLERMRASLPVDDLRVRQALAYADVRVSRDRSLEDMLASPKSAGLSADQQKLLATLRLIGDDAALPVSPRLTGEWMRMLVDAGVGDGAQMLERHGDELKRRGEAGDVIALETLAALYAMTDDPALATSIAWASSGRIPCGSRAPCSTRSRTRFAATIPISSLRSRASRTMQRSRATPRSPRRTAARQRRRRSRRTSRPASPKRSTPEI